MKKFFFTVFALFACIALFAATMDSRVRAVPKNVQELVFQNPEEGLPLVVKSLTANANGASAKVKVLHDWICDNIAYDTELYFYGGEDDQDPETVLKKKKDVCSGYTNLMTVMCRLAGIEAIGIAGYSKGFGYRGKVGEKPDHAWNAVKINNRWQLIDVTWDAGYVDYKTFIKRYSTEWLNRTPEQFIFSHLPEEDEYQYLKEIKTKEQFEKEPYLAGVFFDYGLSLGDSKPGYTNEISGAVKYDFKVGKTGVVVMSDLLETNSGRLVHNATWIDRTINKTTVDFDIPSAKKYKARVLARFRNEVKIPQFFSVSEFEGEILPEAQGLVAEKKVTQKEFEFLQESYFLVDENRRYYLNEDLFANARNNAVMKILKLLDQTSFYEEVISVALSAASGYSGFGESVVRFPTTYTPYNESSNTHLVSPISGVLSKGSVQKFVVDSKDFTGVAVSIGGQLTLFKKNPKGEFELETTVPVDSDQLVVYGSRNGKTFSSIWSYVIE